MDQYMTPVQSPEMQQQQQYPSHQMTAPPPPQQVYQGQQPMVQYPQQMPSVQQIMPPIMQPLMAAQPSEEPIEAKSQMPDWVGDIVVIGAIVFAFGHPSTRAMLSKWLPMLQGERQGTVMGLLVFSLLVGGGATLARRLIGNRL